MMSAVEGGTTSYWFEGQLAFHTEAAFFFLINKIII